jgi:tetratricopeptide (TPR) repeat protein
MIVSAPPVSPELMVEALLALPTRAARRRQLAALLEQLDGEQAGALAEALKEAVVRSLWADVPAALDTAGLILDLARLTGSELHRALGLRARAQVLMIGYGEHQRALRLYRRALAIHRRHNDPLGQAMIYLTSVWAMASTGQYRQALEAGEWAAQVLRDHGQWKAYATLQNNLAAIHNRSFNYTRALEYTERACQGFLAMGEAGKPFLANNEVNRALALCSLGRFAEALQAGESALRLAVDHDQKIVYARAQHNLAITHYLMGEYNRALELLLLARQAHAQAGQPHEAAQCDLSITDCLLELNRLEAAQEKCQEVLPLFIGLGMRLEAAEAAHNQAVAFRRMGRINDAIAALRTVRGLFADENLPHWVAQADTEIAQLHERTGQPALALPLAEAAAGVFASLSLPYETAQANLVAARAQLSLGAAEAAGDLVRQALEAAEAGGWPSLVFQAYHLLARCTAGDAPEQALAHYTQAAEALERLRGQVMLEFRAGFLEEREAVYAEAVLLCLQMGDDARAFAFAERARSRALTELLSGQEARSLRARHPGDIPLVSEIQRLASERQQFARRLDYLALDAAPRVDEEILGLQGRILALEKQITELWHNLLIRNAAYTQDAARWDVLPDLPLPEVPPGTLLLSYFAAGDELVLFLVRPGAGGADGRVRAARLPGGMAQVERLVQALHLNLRAVPVSRPAGVGQASPALEASAVGLLRRLHDLLLAPAQAELAQAERLCIIPHGALQTLPFHALHDGQRYLVETHCLRILPAASFLRGRGHPRSEHGGTLALGHSFQGSLPQAVAEARAVADFWGAEPVLEEQATLARLRADGPACRLLHLACHGTFRPDNPLFSGLALEDGWLTTFDIYNIPLSASLVTLSACQTGRSTAGGGGELFGLMRAFLSAGAAALVLSLWPVDDQAAARLMEDFYRRLAAGEDKDAALRQAQLALLHPTDGAAGFGPHPYFWAPFFLVGDDGPL